MKKKVALLMAVGSTMSIIAACSSEPAKEVEKPAEKEDKAVGYMNATGFPIAKDKITIKAMGLKDPGERNGTTWSCLRRRKS